MSIHLYCRQCRSSCQLKEKMCPKCGNLFPREGKKYRVSVKVKGKVVNRIVDNVTIAREVEAAIKSDLVREEFDITHHKAKKAVTLGDVWEKYLPWAKEHKKTWKDDEYHYHRHLEPRFGKKVLDAITSFDIEKMKLDFKRGLNMHGKPFAAATIKHQIVLLRRLFNLASKWNLYQGKNPVSAVEMPHVDNQITEFLTDEELSRLLEVLDNWSFDNSAAFVKYAMLSGFRRSEIFKLQWEHVDFERNLVTLPDPKGKKTVIIPVSKEALDVLNGLNRTSKFVFPGRNGGQRTDFKGPWARIRKAAGLPDRFRFHGLRHNFASQLISSGVDLAVVGKLLSHKQAQTTMRYAHLRPDVVQAAAAESGKLFEPKKKTMVRLTKK